MSPSLQQASAMPAEGQQFLVLVCMCNAIRHRRRNNAPSASALHSQPLLARVISAADLSHNATADVAL